MQTLPRIPGYILLQRLGGGPMTAVSAPKKYISTYRITRRGGIRCAVSAK